jgi:PadR family transcriptional regulator, regulatory protein PadR
MMTIVLSWEPKGATVVVKRAPELLDKVDVPQGTLELMILTILAREPLHGYGLSQRLTALSHDHFRVNPGSLFPSLYRLEQDGKLKAEWRPSENNRNAKYYALTSSGRRQLEQHKRRWERVSLAISSVLEGA